MSRRGIPTSWRGQVFPSKAAAARAAGLTPHELHDRLHHRRMTIDQALAARRAPAPVVWRGQEFATIVAAARAAGLSKETVASRLARGWSLDAALSTPARRRARPSPGPTR